MQIEDQVSMKPIILFRESVVEKEELEIAKKHFEVTFSRVNLDNRLVIGRYSVLPFYKELEFDLNSQGSKLINSYAQHSYIANFSYYQDLEPYTFKTWFRLQDIPEQGPFVVKGVTNSKKHEWETKMFAQTKRDAVKIAVDLMNDSLIGTQDIIVRKFEELEIVDTGVSGLPMANEWRFFCYQDKILTNGFYWSSTDQRGILDQAGIDLVQTIANQLKDRLNFYVVDVAKKKDGSWVMIELNDGSMSGLSECSAEELYSNLAMALKK